MMTSKRLLAVAVSAALYAPLSAFATNGMNMEGYGPIATGMGGASMAYDNGTAAMMNNVATLGLAPDGSRLDVAVGVLSPDIHADGYTQGGTQSGDSQSTQFVMPAVGWAKKNGALTFGAGMFAQGGMGAEYNIMLPDGSFGTDRSEVGVGRLIFPVAFNVNNALTVGASIDYVWATMDLQMTAPGSMLGAMVTGGSMASSLPSMMTPTTYGRFDFSDSSDFSGEAQGAGFAGKLGLTYKVSPSLTVGFGYQSETAMDDLETGGSSTTMTFYNVNTPGGVANVPLTGKMTVKNFQWPTTYGLGFAYQENDKLMVALDLKRIQWADVMKDFKMSFMTDGNNGPMSNMTLDFTMPQNWKDQTVIQAGISYKATDAATVRFGANFANNPVPDSTVNPLFPATVKDHYTFGLGYAFAKAQSVDFSMVVGVENSSDSASGAITHSQTNYQLMYSNRF